MTTFQELGLDPLLLKALDTEGYTTPTPIQAQAIPTVLEGKDLLGIAQTGTGKTAAFALPILQRLNTNRQPPLRKGVRALILSPTRELATQIAESFRTYGRHMGFSVAVVFGGVAHKPQRDALARGVDVLVATPGRLLDHMGERNVTLEGTEILVLDEADQMMDLGFIRPLRQIVATLSHRRQSLFFSATMPHEIGALAAELLKDPVKVSVTPVAKTADRVTQEVIFVEQQKKRALLVELFAKPDMTRTIVFTRTKRGADRVARHLESAGVPVAAIHGNKSQAQRDQAMRGFKAGKIRALIATDIAARGIDVDAVSHVINYEIPNVPESYVHRIGRTARAGAEGIAISLVDNEERAYLRDIERLTRLTIPSTDRRNDPRSWLRSKAGPSAKRSVPICRQADRVVSGRDAVSAAANVDPARAGLTAVAIAATAIAAVRSVRATKSVRPRRKRAAESAAVSIRWRAASGRRAAKAAGATAGMRTGPTATVLRMRAPTNGVASVAAKAATCSGTTTARPRGVLRASALSVNVPAAIRVDRVPTTHGRPVAIVCIATTPRGTATVVRMGPKDVLTATTVRATPTAARMEPQSVRTVSTLRGMVIVARTEPKDVRVMPTAIATASIVPVSGRPIAVSTPMEPRRIWQE